MLAAMSQEKLVTLAWNRDGKNGIHDPNTSLKILLDWLLDDGNYNRYRGKDNSGMTKIRYCELIAQHIKAAGVRCERLSNQVRSKIDHLEATFCTTDNWVNCTGVGVRESHGAQQFDEIVKGKCPNYYDLAPIMLDRASTRPAFTTSQLLQAESDNIAALLATGAYDSDSTLDSQRSTTLESSGTNASRDNSSAAPAGISHITTTKLTKANSSKKRTNAALKLDNDKLTSIILQQMAKQASRYDENKRHNKSMEQIELRKLEAQKSAEGRQFSIYKLELKTKAMEYDNKVMEQFHKMVNEFKWEYAVIAHALPASIKYFPGRRGKT
jgi:hypothetical protein